jgi:hypothetical protein
MLVGSYTLLKAKTPPVKGSRRFFDFIPETPVRIRADLSRRVFVLCGAIAELANMIFPPSPERAIRFKSDNVSIPGRNRFPVRIRADLNRTAFVHDGAIAELA